METISILGDSISTFEGEVPAHYVVFYQAELKQKTGVENREQTWWAQVASARNAHILANSSFSGSMVEGAGFPAANSNERIAALAGAFRHANSLASQQQPQPQPLMQLQEQPQQPWSELQPRAQPQECGVSHAADQYDSSAQAKGTSQAFSSNDSSNSPDTILIFMGINDYGWGGPRAQASGRSGATPLCLNLGDYPEQVAGEAPENAAENFGVAYDEMLQRIRSYYPQAQVWCCTLLPGRTEGFSQPNFAYRLRGIHLDDYNHAIRKAAEKNRAHIADIRALGREYESLEGTHPTQKGMKQLASMVLYAMDHESDLRSAAGCEQAASQSFEGAPFAHEQCGEPSCVVCNFAGSTNNKWLCTCSREF